MPELTGKLDILRRRIERWKPHALAVTNVARAAHRTRISRPPTCCIRGDYRQPGEAVKPGFPSAITGNSEPAVLETDRYRQFPTRGRRMTLARWIASPENPLTARVMVNRIWQHHFGSGIVGPQRFRQERRAAHASGTARLAGRAVRRGGLGRQGDAQADAALEHVPAGRGESGA